ncbi:MAG: beta-N-acetylglucosaminidase domain-containing protein [Bacteroidales bacterium]|nr:beta-N-acetylglucosaminidase domain-containing protein [Bacteroidales bacterium]
MKKLFTLLFLVFIATSSFASYKIYPTPQKITMGSGEVTLTTRMNVVLEDGVPENVKTYISETLKAKGISPAFNRFSSSSKYIYVGVNGSGKEADTYATQCGLSRSVFSSGSNKYDPYLLHVTSDGNIVILGNANNSVFYGVSTLRQMLNSNKTLNPVTIEDYAYTQYRGLVEGFYGKPYTVEQIISLLEFFKHYKLNTFIYGPKADPYHAGSWYEDYPTTLSDSERKLGLLTQSDFVTITAKAKECNVNFVWAIHPGLHGGMSFDSKSAMNPGIEKIMQKFDKMYNLGVRGFGVFIDDMSFTPNAEMTAYLPAQVQAKLKAKYNTSSASADDKVSPLFFVPTAYSIAHTTTTLTQLSSIDKDVVIAFTGDNVWSNITAANCQTMKNVLGRNPLFWWNNNCNDNYDDRLYMSHMNYRYTAQNAPITALGGVVFNPMQEGEASKIFLFGGADYCWNTASFNSQQNWNDCFAYLFPDNADLATAFKTFCLNTDATAEPSDMISLYNSFKNGYSYGNLPSSTTASLIEKCGNIYDACMALEIMKNSPTAEEALMYEDIKFWSKKLASMSNIIKSSLSWMKNPGSMNEWIDYANVSKEYAKLHKDSAHIAYTVEGTGTDANGRYFEVHPAQTNMEPFVDYLMTKYYDYAPSLPTRNRNAEIIHNLSVLPASVSLSSTTSNVKLNGLTYVTMSSGDYVGINLNSIKEVTVSASNYISSDFYYEYSVNGKEWTPFTPNGTTAIELAYVRVRNVSRNVTKEIGIPSITINIPTTGVITPVSASTNITQYEGNAVSNVINYSNDSFFWGGAAQNAGDYIRVDLGSSKNIYKVEIEFDSNDQPSGDCAIEVSGNGSSWSNVATFTSANIVDKKYSVVVDNATGRYVQMRLISTKGELWLKVIKVKVYEGREIAVAEDNKGVFSSALDDRSLATSYCATEEGWITYDFTENLNFETIQIFHNSTFDSVSELPAISLLADGEWIDMGYLNEALTELNVSALKNIKQMKIEWNSVNIPDIYDVVVTGTPYVGDHDLTGVEENITPETAIFFEGDNLQINGVEGAVTIYNASGIAVWQGNLNGSLSLPVNNNGVYIVATPAKVYKVVKY